MQARWQRSKAPRDMKFFSLTLKYHFLLMTTNYPRSFRRVLLRSLFSTTTQLSNWSHTIAMSLKWHTRVQHPKHLQQKIAAKHNLRSGQFFFFFWQGKKNREYHIDETLLTTASETIDLGPLNHYRQPSVVSTHKSDVPESKPHS